MVAAYTTRASRRTASQTRPEREKLPTWAHPSVVYWYDEWQLIRDCIGGEKDIKDRKTDYLPVLEGMDTPEEYAAYLDRATFYNFTGRTVAAMTGTLFRRAPTYQNLPETFELRLENISDTNATLRQFAQQVGTEILTLGRAGVLADMPAVEATSPNPYLTLYTAENILDWTEERDPTTGRVRLTRVVLREFELIQTTVGATLSQIYAARYRELRLDAGVYTNTYYTNAKGDADITAEFRQDPVTPLRRGSPLTFIPFRLFCVLSTSADIDKSPMLDIARLNISHYRSYAHLEHGRFFTGLPIYWAEKVSDDGGAYVIGPSTVWDLPPGGKAGIIECNGQGLKFLENACASKEAQAASLGGRLIGVTAQSTAETDNQSAMKDRNEQAVLLCIALGLDAGFTTAVRWLAWLSNEPEAVANAISVEFDKDFLFDSTGAREFRAIQSMYEAGILPIEVVYDAMRKADVIPDFMSLKEFKKLLETKSSFPNNPDFQARKEGYPDALTKITQDNHEADREAEADNLDTELEASAREAAKARAAAKDAAKAAAKARPATPAPGKPKPPV